MPDVSAKFHGRLVDAGKSLLEARKRSGASSLADLYYADAVPKAVVDAHRQIDRLVDQAFGFRSKGAADQRRLTLLLDRYASLAGTDLA
jgi:hypothetical protein